MTDENIHIGKLFKQMIGYWKIYIPIGIICLIGGILYILITPKEYDITARIQILGEKQGMMSELKMLKSSGLGGILGGGGGGANSKDEIFIIKSRNNISKAIKETEYQIETTIRKGLKEVILDKEEMPISYILPTSFLDTLSIPVNIEFKIENSRLKEVEIKSILFKTRIYNQSIPCELNLPIGKISIIQNFNQNGTFITKINPMQKVYESVIDEVNINPSETTSDILVLSSQSANKLRSCKLLNSIMNNYNKYSKGVKIQETELNAIFVKNKLDTVTSELAQLERKIELYKQVNKMPDPGLYGSVTYMGNRNAEKLILDTETRLRMIDYIINYIKSPENRGTAIPLIEGIGDKIIGEYNQLIFKRQQLAISSEITNPAVKLLDQQISEQCRVLIESVENIRKNIQIGLNALYKENATLSKQVNMLPAQEREYIEMLRQQKIKEAMYTFLLQKKQEKELSNSPDELAGRIIDTAYSSYKPIFPKKLIVFGIAFLITCILSLIIISIKIIKRYNQVNNVE